MRSTYTWGLGALAAALLLSPLAAAQSEVRSFPVRVGADFGERGVEWLPLPAEIEALSALDKVRLEGVPVAGGRVATLELRRLPVAQAGASCYVDGAKDPAALESGTSLWAGTVAGAATSDVFLALSRHGTRGWIEQDGEMIHVLAQPLDGADWSATRSIAVPERVFRELGLQPELACAASGLKPPGVAPPPAPRGGTPLAATAPTPLPIYQCAVAVETDWQFFQLFGNLPAAKAYALALFGAVSHRFREQVGTILTLPYLGFYTAPNDPWHSPESGGGTFAILNEFQGAWQGGGAPVNANLFHFVSGADAGGGIAYLGVLCDSFFGFGVSANLGGNTPIPVSQGPLNWDFMVMAHEIGHNFSTPHTHDFCPPLDQCAPPEFFGACQTQHVCTSQGTLMSYCHLCDGGVANVTTSFHPDCVTLMRAAVVSSCLPTFQGIVGETSLGFALPGASGTPVLDVSFSPNPSKLTFSSILGPANQLGIVIVSPVAAFTPLFGGTMVPTIDFFSAALLGNAAGAASVTVPVALSLPNGVVLFAQGWYLDGTGFSASNALRFELILP